MNKDNVITIKIEGEIGNARISPSNFDITYMRQLLTYAEDLFEGKKGETPITLGEIREGSFMAVFNTSLERAAKFGVLLAMLNASSNLGQFEPRTVRGLENLQKFAKQNNFSIGMSTSVNGEHFSITPTTKLVPVENAWVDAELYYYGKVYDAGGKTKANIHIDTSVGSFTVKVDEAVLKGLKDNPLYKDMGIRVKTKQNVFTGDIDKNNMELLEIIDYSPKFDMDYLSSKIKSATPTWRGVDADEYVHNIREGVYA